jgi:hypothetical protein
VFPLFSMLSSCSGQRVAIEHVSQSRCSALARLVTSLSPLIHAKLSLGRCLSWKEMSRVIQVTYACSVCRESCVRRMASCTWSSQVLGRGSIVLPDLTSLDDSHAGEACVPGDGREDTRTWLITAWQASGTIAIGEPHAGERLVGSPIRYWSRTPSPRRSSGPSGAASALWVSASGDRSTALKRLA